MPTAINKIVDGFPFPTIPPIIGNPTYNTIAEVNFKLNSIYTSAQSNLGCVTLVLIQLTVLRYAFDTASALFNEYDCTGKALRQILLSTVDKMFICSLRHKYFGYGLTSTRTILDHLYATYANISSADLQENDTVFRNPYNINQQIKSLFDRVENCSDYAAAGNTPYSLKQVIGINFQLVYQTGLFVDD